MLTSHVKTFLLMLTCHITRCGTIDIFLLIKTRRCTWCLNVTLVNDEESVILTLKTTTIGHDLTTWTLTVSHINPRGGNTGFFFFVIRPNSFK